MKFKCIVKLPEAMKLTAFVGWFGLLVAGLRIIWDLGIKYEIWVMEDLKFKS